MRHAGILWVCISISRPVASRSVRTCSQMVGLHDAYSVAVAQRSALASRASRPNLIKSPYPTWRHLRHSPKRTIVALGKGHSLVICFKTQSRLVCSLCLMWMSEVEMDIATASTPHSGGFQVFDHSPVPSHDAGPQISLDNGGWLLAHHHPLQGFQPLMHSYLIQSLAIRTFSLLAKTTRCLLTIPESSIYYLHGRLVPWIHEL